MAAACGRTDSADVPPTHSPARAPSVRNTAGGFRPSAQPHGGSLRANGPCRGPTNALASAGTFGAKQRRGLPPIRSAAWRQPAGERTLPTSRQRTRQRGHLRCETSPGASAQPLSRWSAPLERGLLPCGDCEQARSEWQFQGACEALLGTGQGETEMVDELLRYPRGGRFSFPESFPEANEELDRARPVEEVLQRKQFHSGSSGKCPE